MPTRSPAPTCTPHDAHGVRGRAIDDLRLIAEALELWAVHSLPAIADPEASAYADALAGLIRHNAEADR